MRALPSCIVIGSRKGGTRALLDMLSLHSRVRPAKAEVHFFDADDNYRRGYEWYMEQVCDCHRYLVYTTYRHQYREFLKGGFPGCVK